MDAEAFVMWLGQLQAVTPTDYITPSVAFDLYKQAYEDGYQTAERQLLHKQPTQGDQR